MGTIQSLHTPSVSDSGAQGRPARAPCIARSPAESEAMAATRPHLRFEDEGEATVHGYQRWEDVRLALPRKPCGEHPLADGLQPCMDHLKRITCKMVKDDRESNPTQSEYCDTAEDAMRTMVEA